MADDPVNPNEYDDALFLQASENLRMDASLSRHVSALWTSGATASDIRTEFDEAVGALLEDLQPTSREHRTGLKKKKPSRVDANGEPAHKDSLPETHEQ